MTDMLVMVSLDGLRGAALDDPAASITLVTGVRPARHGVLGNTVFDRATGHMLWHEGDYTDHRVAVETLWGVAAIPDNIPEFLEQSLFDRHASRELWRELPRAEGRVLAETLVAP